MGDESTNVDNSLDTNIDVTEPTDNEETVDNSADVDTNNEPTDGEQHQEATEESDKNNAKFKSYEEAMNGYNELEKKLGQQSNELGELRKKAELADRLQREQLQMVQNYGFNSVADYQQAQQKQQYEHALAGYEADEYAKFINQCDNPEEARSILMMYKQNPSKEALEYIEAEFPLEAVKQVNRNKALYEGQLKAQQQQAHDTAIYNSAKEYLEANVNKYAEEFKNPALSQIYAEAFKAYGCDLQTDTFMNMMKAYKDSIIKEYRVQNGIKNDNINATDEISSLGANSSNISRGQEKDILQMTEAEIKQELKKYK